jgi:hypothetical protein
MRYYVEFDVFKFEFWGPAKRRIETLKRYNKYDAISEIGNLIEEIFSSDDADEMEINDFVSYDSLVDEVYDEALKD